MKPKARGVTPNSGKRRFRSALGRVSAINSWHIADKEELQDLSTSCEAQDESLAAFRQQLAEDRRASLIQPQSPEDMAELVVGLLQRNEGGKYSNLRAELVSWVLTDWSSCSFISSMRACSQTLYITL